jgi:hypothetical protein
MTPAGCATHGCDRHCIDSYQRAAEAKPLTFPELDALSMREADGPDTWAATVREFLRRHVDQGTNPFNVDMTTPGVVTLNKLTAKDTNPKDAIGIRKAPMSTVPANVMAEVGVAMVEGAGKYGRHNYRAAGVRASVYYDALMRHAFSWWEGEDLDPDSGLSHIVKAIACLTVLRDAMTRGMWTDDRPPRSAPFYPGLNDDTAALMDKHADKNPHHYTQADPVAVPTGEFAE